MHKIGAMRMLSVGIMVLFLGIGAGVAGAQDDEQYSAISFVVLRDYNGKPVKNASVIMHPVNKKGKQKNTGFQLKTNSDGKTSFDGIPYGPLRVQVLAQGFQTFGEDYQVDKPEVEIVVKLKRPQGQYSIYEEHPEAKDEGRPPEPTAPPKSAETKPQ